MSDQVPTKLARGVCEKADEMEILAVVQALEKCQSMALKVKAAKFLKSSTKDDIQELRAYAEQLVLGGTND